VVAVSFSDFVGKLSGMTAGGSVNEGRGHGGGLVEAMDYEAGA
jgi:hypothetical protein